MHSEETKPMCDLCGFAASSKKLLRAHIQTEHEGLRYKCEECDYVAKSSGTLRRHQQSVHEGRKYPCDQCTYMATAPNALKRHIQSIHELVKHPCDSCNYRQACGFRTDQISRIWVLDNFFSLHRFRTVPVPYLSINPDLKSAPIRNFFFTWIWIRNYFSFRNQKGQRIEDLNPFVSFEKIFTTF